MKKYIYSVAAAIVLIGALYVIKLPVDPPDDTRMVLDHTKRIYIAPPCFETAEATNYLSDSTWKDAKKSNYEPESECTAELMQPKPQSLWQIINQSLGLGPKRSLW
ncbi:hypothetical protein EBB07_27590 [Paenibacillaceae bacterium]|nr:hypothetical protein EBB07_27590 [Paenibacillaceae bacterium]